MPLELDSRDPGFSADFDALVAARREADADVGATVAAIIADVRQRGGEAVAEYTKQFDRIDLAEAGWEIPAAERKAALAGIEPSLRQALQCAADRIARLSQSTWKNLQLGEPTRERPRPAVAAVPRSLAVSRDDALAARELFEKIVEAIGEQARSATIDARRHLETLDRVERLEAIARRIEADLSGK